MKRLWYFLREVRWFIILGLALALGACAVAAFWPTQVALVIALGLAAIVSLQVDKADRQ